VRERASMAAAQLSAVLGQRVEQTRSREPVRLTAVR
jgi:FMN reductase